MGRGRHYRPALAGAQRLRSSRIARTGATALVTGLPDVSAALFAALRVTLPEPGGPLIVLPAAVMALTRRPFV